MKNLIIIGAGSFGREVAAFAPQCHGYGSEWLLKGFIDSDVNRLNAYPGKEPIIGFVDEYMPQPADVFICAIGDTKVKKKYVLSLMEMGAVFV